jgi:putative membrane protein
MSCLVIDQTNDWMHHMWGWGIWGMGWGMFFVVIVLFFLGFMFYSMYYRPPRRYSEKKETPLEIAKNRLAKGEISTEEYEEIMKRLVEKT